VILIAVACLAAVVVAVLVWPGEREPEYQGKKLSEWLAASVNYQKAGSLVSMPQADEAPYAVRQIGTSALPFLLKWLQYREPPWKAKAYYCFRKLPQMLQSHSLERRLWVDSRPDLSAVNGFLILGAQAAPAIPELVRLMHDSQRPDVSMRAIECLFCTREAGLPEMRAALRSTDPALRSFATSALAGAGMPPPLPDRRKAPKRVEGKPDVNPLE
jgi:hypothetical protein